MALPEISDAAEHNQEAVSADEAAGGVRDARHPVPTMDGFAGELPGDSNADTLSQQAVITSIAQTVTSVTGSEALGVVGKNTASQPLGCLSNSTPEALPKDAVKDKVNEHVNEVASYKECSTNSTENPEDALNAPSLSTDSLKSSLPPLSVQRDTEVVRESKEVVMGDSVQTPPARYEKTKCDLSHLAESAHTPQHQHMTSGYVSEETQTQPGSQTNSRWRRNSCHSKKSRHNISSCGSKESRSNIISCLSKKKSKDNCAPNSISANSGFLQLSEEGVEELKRMSGTQHEPLHKEYLNFVFRVQSFKDLSSIYGVKKDVLALAGFFYSGSGTVTCYHCGCSPRVWEERSEPKHMHFQLTPNCRFIRPLRKWIS
ncbi:uncharacterized protein [Haliotis cracherodii]|uniref:uncharacterized protein n=1 Tax=Haliotis cracherodii TaxID=6455 RepID=UPI0039E7A238